MSYMFQRQGGTAQSMETSVIYSQHGVMSPEGSITLREQLRCFKDCLALYSSSKLLKGSYNAEGS